MIAAAALLFLLALLYFFSLHLGYYRLFPSAPLKGRKKKQKKNGQQISILLSGNINRAHATSTLHSSHCSSPDASCFFGSFCTDPTRLTHGLEAERWRVLAVAPPLVAHPLPQTKSKGWYLMTDRFRTPINPIFFFLFIYRPNS